VDGVSWRLSVRHQTGYHYTGSVLASYNEARITPLTDTGQLTIDAAVEVYPPTNSYRYWDYWGALVDAFDVHVPHTHLSVTGRSLVETSVADDPASIDRSATWAALAGNETADRFEELLRATAYVPLARDGDLSAAAVRLRSEAATPDEAARAAAAWVQDALVYERGITRVSTSALEAWHAGHGVCQDFAHLTLSLLRTMGVPARYVSGYLHPNPEAAVGETVAGESHAWVEWWVGDWVRFDPTNGIDVGERHVVVARGRDYADVPPLKGIYSGGAAGDLEVTVELTRTA
jgi:transglutaminase-like putative cysteine protease